MRNAKIFYHIILWIASIFRWQFSICGVRRGGYDPPAEKYHVPVWDGRMIFVRRPDEVIGPYTRPRAASYSRKIRSTTSPSVG